MSLNYINSLHQQFFYNCHTNPLERDMCWTITSPSVDVDGSVLRDVDVQLENEQMWRCFHAETTEMIITKLGRRMFPSIQIRTNGLDRRTRYHVLMEIIPASKRRHKYIGSGDLVPQDQSSNPGGRRKVGWTIAGAGEPQPPVNRRLYLHPDSPATGAHWMQQSINFTKLKLTNNGIDHHNNVVLTSMHKYIPRIWIIRAPDSITTLSNLFTQPAVSFIFPETVFIAVTAYQNENITKLKINNNPFAKGFRETGHSRCKRKFDDTSRDGIHDDEDGGNVSLFDLELHERDAKRNVEGIMCNMANSDDSGVSNSSEIFLPPSIPPFPFTIQEVHDHRRDRPRLHRPWADSPSTSTLAVSNNFAPLHPSSDAKFKSFDFTTNHTAINSTHFPTILHSIEHQTFDVALQISRYRYYLPLDHQTTKIHNQRRRVFLEKKYSLSNRLSFS